MKKSTYAYIAACIVILGVLAFLSAKFNKTAEPASSQNYEALAECIKDSGASFYGAFWCPHCRDQKAEFGAAADKLPYIECSTPDGKAQTEACTDKGIQGYPTWYFADSTSETGVLSLQELSQKTNCSLAGAANEAEPPAPSASATASSSL